MNGAAATDTIAAIATATGRAALGILRLSGPRAHDIARSLTVRDLPPPRQAALRAFRAVDGSVLDRGLLLCFHAPDTHTGEDVAELQVHGGSVLLDLLLRACVQAGARIARPGEFTERAFVNGRMDLAQAEAVADLIDASSRAAVAAAQRSLEGEFSRRVEALAAELMSLRAWVEGALDFSDEDVDWLGDAQLSARLSDWLDALDKLKEQAAQGRRLREGLVVAIAGRPNVGKSTLLNRLAGADVAIVSEMPGTTRDLLREQLVVDGLPLQMVDTAGLRETQDPVEQEGIRRAWSALERAEVVLFLVDDRSGPSDDDRALLARMPETLQRIVVFNKCDLTRQPPSRRETDRGVELRLSAHTGEGLDLLRAQLRQCAGLADQEQPAFTARSRHLLALEAARQHAATAAAGLSSRQLPELVAEEIRLAQSALGEITGAVCSEDLLSAIFASFCIGK